MPRGIPSNDHADGYIEGTDSVIFWIGGQYDKPTRPPTIREIAKYHGLPYLTEDNEYADGWIEGVKSLLDPCTWPDLVNNYY